MGLYTDEGELVLCIRNWFSASIGLNSAHIWFGRGTNQSDGWGRLWERGKGVIAL